MVTYNSLNKLKKSLLGLEETLKREDVIELIIFDNGSDQKTVIFLKQFSDLEKVKVIFSKKNLGCGGARKELMSLVKGNKILSLDPDIIVKNNSFLDLLIDAEACDNFSIIGFAGGNINKEKIQFDIVKDDYVGEVDAVCGYCQFFDKDILDKGCAIDSFYKINGEEDFDFCLSAEKVTGKKSYKLKQDNSKLFHDYSYTNRNNLDRRNKNFKYMFKKFGIYEKSFTGKLKFYIKSSVIFKKINRLIGKISI